VRNAEYDRRYGNAKCSYHLGSKVRQKLHAWQVCAGEAVGGMCEGHREILRELLAADRQEATG
jgi:hypothetical protein